MAFVRAQTLTSTQRTSPRSQNSRTPKLLFSALQSARSSCAVLPKQGYVKYTEGSEFVDTRENLIADGDPDGGGLKEMDEKLTQ